eukprot:COSAG01_NODE_23283_length_821_cov_0.768698_2_plen_44_part_01
MVALLVRGGWLGAFLLSIIEPAVPAPVADPSCVAQERPPSCVVV